MKPYKIKALALLCGLTLTAPAPAQDIQVECPQEPWKPEPVSRKAVYDGVPYRQGEKSTFEVTWAGLKAGYGSIEVRRPLKHKGQWHQVFHVEASTGDWFKTVFVAKDSVDAYSQPGTYAISKFYIEQNEGKIFSTPLKQKKWLEFDHATCKVQEKVQKDGEPAEVKTHDLSRGAMDALGVIFYLRTRDFVKGKVERAPVYSSEKNWWLEAMPLGEETLEVPAGKFKAMKLKLTTFLGKELQQQGDVYAWIATDRPSRPLVQLQGEIKIGNVWMKLHHYKEGK
jgi:hypothetical protein